MTLDNSIEFNVTAVCLLSDVVHYCGSVEAALSRVRCRVARVIVVTMVTRGVCHEGQLEHRPFV